MNPARLQGLPLASVVCQFRELPEAHRRPAGHPRRSGLRRRGGARSRARLRLKDEQHNPMPSQARARRRRSVGMRLRHGGGSLLLPPSAPRAQPERARAASSRCDQQGSAARCSTRRSRPRSTRSTRRSARSSHRNLDVRGYAASRPDHERPEPGELIRLRMSLSRRPTSPRRRRDRRSADVDARDADRYRSSRCRRRRTRRPSPSSASRAQAAPALEGLRRAAPAAPCELARDPDADGASIDEALRAVVPGAAQLHRRGRGRAACAWRPRGGRARSLDALWRSPGLRLAEPGEFTRRAFENGKLDLTAGRRPRRSGRRRDRGAAAPGAARSSRARCGALYEAWRARLLRALAQLEAGLDFRRRGCAAACRTSTAGAVVATRDEIRAISPTRGAANACATGSRVAIVGAPNAGKSSLLNRSARRDAAIVSANAGTTRDVIEVHLDLGGYAGDRSPTRPACARPRDGSSTKGIDRALARAEAADLSLWVVDAIAPVWQPPRHEPRRMRRKLRNSRPYALFVPNKIDLAPDARRGRRDRHRGFGEDRRRASTT